MAESGWRSLVIACLGSVVGLAGLRGEARVVERLTVRTYDAVGVRANEMQAARQTGSRILERAGLAIVWVDCTTPGLVPGPCDAPLEPRELVVRLSSAGAGASSEALGEAYIDVQRGHGVLATVFADRVQVVAHNTKTSAGRLLGRALAHEIGHLLLGSTDHAERGLMRGRWLESEIWGNSPTDWFVGEADASRMRYQLAARARSADEVLTGLRGVSVRAALDGAAHS